ncbi:MAG TPA: glycosyltransferase family 4 protein [Candidatus Sumerlaeota bacterium]|nr:glycosyltransferase family 4 protein [Candidatus Sumerlaeota bacterium]HOR28161.1 glycosyltransferase family 4 protein [Candidatus Sumerlaeota bacterium]HPK01726.1 glycosyltransferase family 4 protein [Candidatus Sumerlaeota bacterium]
MARVMIIGYGPLPRTGMPYIGAAALRTRHLLKPILDAGHTVNLYTLPIPATEGTEGEVSSMVPDTYEGLTYQRFTNHSAEFAVRMLTEQVRQLEPDALVGVNTYPAYIACLLPTALPVWADLNGYWMAEMQGRCWIEEDDSMLADAWAIERAIVRRCDKFSAVSRPQLHAVLGEMAAVGRLNRHTFDYQFGHHLPNACYRWQVTAGEGSAAGEPLLRGPVVPEDAFVLLWSGGFNVWADVATLVRACDLLMQNHPNVHFVSTGGRIEGVVTRVYDDFVALVEQSPYKDRYHLLGWIESDKLPAIHREADVGLNVDSRNYETMFGARNRINAMAIEGLAVATTIGTEISEWLDDGHAVIAAPMGDPEALAYSIAPWIMDRSQLKVFAQKAKRIMEEDFSYERTTRGLVQWLEAPALAPDNQAKISSRGGRVADLNTVAVNSLEEEALLLARHRLPEIQDALAQARAREESPRKRFRFW